MYTVQVKILRSSFGHKKYTLYVLPLSLIFYAGSHCRSTLSSSPSPFLLSLTDSLLSLSSPTRGKYQLLSTMSHHLPITTLLSTAPTLPTELLSVMGHQALACHVRMLIDAKHIYNVHYVLELFYTTVVCVFTIAI